MRSSSWYAERAVEALDHQSLGLEPWAESPPSGWQVAQVYATLAVAAATAEAARAPRIAVASSS